MICRIRCKQAHEIYVGVLCTFSNNFAHHNLFVFVFVFIQYEYTVGLTASCFGLGATLSNLLGQIIVENMGHVASLSGSLVLSVIPVVLFALGMPETYGQRGKRSSEVEVVKSDSQLV